MKIEFTPIWSNILQIFTRFDISLFTYSTWSSREDWMLNSRYLGKLWKICIPVFVGFLFALVIWFALKSKHLNAFENYKEKNYPIFFFFKYQENFWTSTTWIWGFLSKKCPIVSPLLISKFTVVQPQYFKQIIRLKVQFDFKK